MTAMMRLRLIKLISACALTVGAATAQQSEQPLSVSGDLLSGYSGVNNGAGLDSGPYIGFQAFARGFWKDPRILSFSVNPTVGRGITREGAISGPDGDGVAASATFLGGSRAPLTATYGYQFSPAPDINRVSDDFQGLDLTRKDFGLDWNTDFRHLPPIDLAYRKSSDQSEVPGRAMVNDSRDFTALTRFELLRWGLSAAYSNSHGQSSVDSVSGGASVSANGARSDAQSFNATALRALPLDSKLLFDGGWTSTDLDLGDTQTASSYNHVGASINSQPFTRLTLNGRASYLSNASDFLRAQVLGSQLPIDPLSLTSNLGRESLSYSTGASFRVLSCLSVNGNYNATEALSQSGQDINAAGGDGHGIGAGINFNHALWRGQFFSSYSHALSVMDAGGTATTQQSESSSDTVVGGYSRKLPYSIDASGTVDYTVSNIRYATLLEDVRGWGIKVQARRPLNAGWMLSGTFSSRTASQQLLSWLGNGSKSLSLSIESNRLQFTGAYTRTYGLAYLFGSRLIFVPGATQFPDIPSLPVLSQSDSSFFNIAAAYKISRRLSVNAAYYRGAASTSTSFGDSMHGFDAHARYRFRQIWLVAGYRRDMRNLEGASTPSFAAQSFYVMMRRHFTLF
jgi:hypothetical protein